MRDHYPLVITVTLIGVFLFFACSQPGDAAGSILAYLEALASREADTLVSLSCADWEAQARTDLEAFSALTIALEDASCAVSGEEGETTIVSCTGKIIANYGNEILEIDLSERTYQAVFEAGEWRMCGYR